MFVLPWAMPRTLKQILDHLEGPGFDTHLHLASGIQVAKRLCEADPSWQDLVRILQLHGMAGGDAPDIVSARFWSWASMELPKALAAYSHPKDAACFAVLHAVTVAAPERFEAMVAEVDLSRGWFWLVMLIDVVRCSRETERTPGSTAPRSACSG